MAYYIAEGAVVKGQVTMADGDVYKRQLFKRLRKDVEICNKGRS